MATQHTLSIVTIHLNDFSGLSATRKSVEPFLGNERLEWVVVDGASIPEDEQQAEILETARGTADVFNSEPDTGIYAAMNTGTRLASGSYLLYLNAGDLLHPDFCLNAILKLLDTSNPGMLWGVFDEAGKSNAISDIKPRTTNWLWWGMPTSHQAIVFQKAALGEPAYDESLKIAGDYDLLFRLISQSVKPEIVDEPICIADSSGVSNTRLNAALNEQMLVRHRHLGTGRTVNLAISAAHLLIGWIGKVPLLRRIWK